MELILINERKLKVILSPSDMACYGISCDELDYSSTETKRLFWEILDKAKHKTGFDGADSKLSVKVFSSRDGGCEMFVTKCGRQQNADVEKAVRAAVVTCDIEAVIELCIRLAKSFFKGESELYISENGEYYLLVGKNRMPSYIRDKGSREDFPDFLCEYGCVTEMCEIGASFISEHMRKLAGPDAVGLFSEKFG